MFGNFTEYLYLAPNLNLFLILCLIIIPISIGALFFIKWFMPLHIRYQENAVIASTSAFIIVIYGVLAGFATLVLSNNEAEAAHVMQYEANAMANLYRDSLALSEPLRAKAQEDIKKYANEFLTVEWPLMNADTEVKSHADLYIRDLTLALAQYKTHSQGESQIVNDMLTQLSNLYDARQQRIQISYNSLGSTIWVVILMGTILSLCASYIFGVNFYLHIFIVIASALMTISVLFLLISLDKPFAGEADVTPDAIQNVVKIMEAH